MTAWIGVDLDGTLAKYESGDWPKIGEPIIPMVDRVKGWLVLGIEVRIMTARVTGTQTYQERFAQRSAVEKWCEAIFGKRLPVTAEKDFDMIELWDDRAIQVVKNTGERADGGK